MSQLRPHSWPVREPSSNPELLASHAAQGGVTQPRGKRTPGDNVNPGTEQQGLKSMSCRFIVIGKQDTGGPAFVHGCVCAHVHMSGGVYHGFFILGFLLFLETYSNVLFSFIIFKQPPTPKMRHVRCPQHQNEWLRPRVTRFGPLQP